MLNILAAERIKLKRNKLLLICSVIAIFLPIIAFPSNENESISAITWIFRLQMAFQLAVYPVLSGFIITFLIQKEYGDQTIINALTAPVERLKYLLGKLIVWFTWYITITFCFLLIVCVRFFALFGESIFFDSFTGISVMILRTGILCFGTLLPVVWIAIMQKKTFYPSLLAAIIITASGLAGLLVHGLSGSIIPWCAVTLLSMPNGDVIKSVAYVSIALCAAAGFGLAVYSFKKQEL